MFCELLLIFVLHALSLSMTLKLPQFIFISGIYLILWSPSFTTFYNLEELWWTINEFLIGGIRLTCSVVALKWHHVYTNPLLLKRISVPSLFFSPLISFIYFPPILSHTHLAPHVVLLCVTYVSLSLFRPLAVVGTCTSLPLILLESLPCWVSHP